MPRESWRPGKGWPFRCSYAWAPNGVCPADMDRFRRWAYMTWGWAAGDVFYMAKSKPNILRGKYEYWRHAHAA